MHSARPSVTQQVVPQPLILGQQSMSKEASGASQSKRDSGIGIGGLVELGKISLKRPASDACRWSREVRTMAVYRLVRFALFFSHFQPALPAQCQCQRQRQRQRQ